MTAHSKPDLNPATPGGNPRIEAEEILSREIADLVKMIARLKEMSLKDEDIEHVVKATVGVGTSDTRLAGLLKARLEFEARADLGKAIHKAVRESFGDLPLFKKLGESGLEEDDPLRLSVKPSGRQYEQPSFSQDLDGEPTAPIRPESTGQRPSSKPAAGRKTGKGRNQNGRSELGSAAANQPAFEF
jgi:hypothetical protein